MGAAEAQIYAEATAKALADAKAKLGFGINKALFGGDGADYGDYGYGGDDKHDDHKDEKKKPSAAGSAAGSGSLPDAAPMSIVHHMAGGKATHGQDEEEDVRRSGQHRWCDGDQVQAHSTQEDVTQGFHEWVPQPCSGHCTQRRGEGIEDMVDPDENEQLWQDADTALQSMGFPTMREG